MRYPTLLLAAALLAPAGGAAEPRIALSDCRIADADGLVSTAARCGTLEVPENPAEPEGLKIALAVAVVPAVAAKAKPDPVVLIAGGPGQGSIEGFAPLLDGFAGLRRERDLLLVDQRGTGGSNRLDCDMPDDAVESGDIPPARLAALARDCLAKLPGRAEFYTTSVAVRDLEAVRAALGYERLNLFGGSYGTRVAQHYARRYPERTRTITLDGVVPPGLALVPRIAIESQRALDGVFARCAADAACDARFPALPSQLAKLDAALRKSPAAMRLADPLTAEPREERFTRTGLVTAVRLLLYSPGTASLLPLLVHEAATNGNVVPLAAQAEMAGEALERAIAFGMHNSVVCAEEAPRFAESADRAALEATLLGPQMVDGMQAICGVWPRGQVDEDFAQPLHSEVPALLLSGEFDPATPADWGERAAAGFTDARHLVFPGQGHGQERLRCAQRIIRRFVDAGTAAGLDTACLDGIRPAPFFLSFSGSAP